MIEYILCYSTAFMLGMGTMLLIICVAVAILERKLK